MFTYSFVITVIALAGIVLLVGLVTYQGILIARLEEDIAVLMENQYAIAAGHNGLVDTLGTKGIL